MIAINDDNDNNDSTTTTTTTTTTQFFLNYERPTGDPPRSDTKCVKRIQHIMNTPHLSFIIFQFFFFKFLHNKWEGHLPKHYSTTTYFTYLPILQYKGELLPLLLLHPFYIIHSILKTITHVLTYLYVLPEHPLKVSIMQFFNYLMRFISCSSYAKNGRAKKRKRQTASHPCSDNAFRLTS